MEQFVCLSALPGSRVITEIFIDHGANGGNGALVIELASRCKIVVADHGQDCCENRYLTSSDDPKHLLGESLMRIRVVDAPSLPSTCGDVHEVQFLEVSTDRDTVILETHNEHNGYYGGFSLKANCFGSTGALITRHSLT